MRLRGGAELEVLLDAALTDEVPAGIDLGRPAWEAAANRAHVVVGKATFHVLLVETLLERRRIDLENRSGASGSEADGGRAKRMWMPYVVGEVDVVGPFVSPSTSSNGLALLLLQDCEIG